MLTAVIHNDLVCRELFPRIPDSADDRSICKILTFVPSVSVMLLRAQRDFVSLFAQGFIFKFETELTKQNRAGIHSLNFNTQFD